MKLLSLFFISLLFFACSYSKPQGPVIEPAWLYKPNINEKTGAIGSSKPHIEGKNVQRRIAISRALDELAQQSGVHVDNIIIRKEKSSALGGCFSTEVESQQSSTSGTINAHIEETWMDPRTKELHIWLIVD